MNKLTLSVSLLLLGASSLAQAGGASPIYVGAAIGATNNNTDTSNLQSPTPCGSGGDGCYADDSDQAWQVYGGFQFAPNLAVEGGYVNLGKTANMGYSDPIHATQETDGFNLVGVASAPLGRGSPLSVYGKAGVYRWTSEAKVESDDADIHGLKVKKSGVDPTIGAGLQYQVDSNVNVRAGWDRYYNVGERGHLIDRNNGSADLKTLDTDVDVFSAGVNFSFL